MAERIGLLLPAANTTLENEAAGRGNVHFHRFDPQRGPEAIAEAARLLAAVKPAGIGLAYATGSYLDPRVYDEELVDALQRTTGVRVVTAARALVDRLRQLGARRVGVVSPYTDAVNEACTTYLTANGFEVVALVGEKPAGPAGDVPADEVRALVLSLPADEVDAIAISCTGLRTLSLLPELRRTCGRPVVSSNKALLGALAS